MCTRTLAIRKRIGIQTHRNACAETYSHKTHMKICIEKAYCQEQPAAHKNVSTWEYGMFGDTSIQRNLQASEQEGLQREKADGYRHKGEKVEQT